MRDVLCIASLGTTDQGESGSQFRVDYLKSSQAVGFYYPDWVVMQKTMTGESSSVLEPESRLWKGTLAKDTALRNWCDQVSASIGICLSRWRRGPTQGGAATAKKPAA
jgi:type III restriction enzyme